MPTRAASPLRKTIATLTAGALLLSTTAASAQMPPPSARFQYRSPAMRVAGIVLTAIGSATLVAGAVVFATDLSHNTGGENDGLVAYLIGMPMMVGSVVFAGVGVPLWVVGSRPPTAASGGPPAWAVPSVAASPGGAALRWTF